MTVAGGAGVAVTVEDETKFALPADAELPSFDDARLRLTAGPKPPVVLRSVYFDTADLRLVAAGITLRRRTRANAVTWELKLPVRPGDTSVRREVVQTDRSVSPPAALADVLLGWTVGEPLVEAATLRTRRMTWLVTDASGTDVAEIVDDEVEQLAGRRVLTRFREVEVERRGVKDSYVKRLAQRMKKAGAQPSGATKLGRVLGVPDPAPESAGKGASLSALLVSALRRATADLLAADVDARLRGDDGIHQLRVACRRMRSDLRAYGSAVDASWRDSVGAELKWLGRSLGVARDAEVVAARLASVSADLGADGERVVADLLERKARTADDVLTLLSSERYFALVAVLRAGAPPVGDRSARDAGRAAVDAAWRKVEKSVRRLRGHQGSDEAWHAVRISAKRARYTAETAAVVLGSDARRLAKAAAEIQDVLGVFHDTALTRAALSSLVAARPDDAAYGLAVGRLVEREAHAAEVTRAALGPVWRKRAEPALRRWRRG